MHPIYKHLLDGGPTYGETDGARQFVINHGRAFAATSIPKGVRRRKPGSCYESCAKIVLDARPELAGVRYAEGFAMRPSVGIPVKHAWLTVDDTAIDPTWHDPAGGDNLDCHYFGVEFPLKALGVIITKRRYFGLLDPADDFVLEALTDARRAPIEHGAEDDS